MHFIFRISQNHLKRLFVPQPSKATKIFTPTDY